ncbi:hypothetical protein EJB05_22822, partial [Eragrostis curvula]
MPLSAPTSASITGRPSRSAIVWGDMTMPGNHLLDIEGYSRTKALPTGQCITSRSFNVGKTSWRIRYYPNGDTSSTDKFISVFLHLEQQSLLLTNNPVKACAKFSLLDRAGKPVASHTRDSGGTQDFSAEGWGFSDFIERARRSSRTTASPSSASSSFTRRSTVRRRGASRRHLRRPHGSWCRRQTCNVTSAIFSPPRRAPTSRSRSPARCSRRTGAFLRRGRPSSRRSSSARAMREHTDTTVIHVYDMEAKVFGDLLRFVYTDTVPDVPGMKLQDEVAMAQHLLVAADRYNLERLKLICEDKLCKLMDISSVANILTLAEQHNCRGLKEACLRFLRSPSTLNAVMKTDGFEHLERSRPSVFKGLFSVAVGMHIYRDEARWTICWSQLIVLVVLCIVLYLKGGNVLSSPRRAARTRRRRPARHRHPKFSDDTPPPPTPPTARGSGGATAAEPPPAAGSRPPPPPPPPPQPSSMSGSDRSSKP